MLRFVEGEERRDLGGRFLSLRKVAVKGGDAVADGKGGTDKCESGVWEERELWGKGRVSQEIAKKEERNCLQLWKKIKTVWKRRARGETRDRSENWREGICLRWRGRRRG